MSASFTKTVDGPFVVDFLMGQRSKFLVDQVCACPRTALAMLFLGRHFMDILEPTIGNLIREVIPGAPKRQKAQTFTIAF